MFTLSCTHNQNVRNMAMNAVCHTNQSESAAREERLRHEAFCDALAFAGTCLMLCGTMLAAAVLIHHAAPAGRIPDVSAVILFGLAGIAGLGAVTAGARLVCRTRAGGRDDRFSV